MCAAVQAGSGADPRQALEEPQFAIHQQEQAAVSGRSLQHCRHSLLVLLQLQQSDWSAEHLALLPSNALYSSGSLRLPARWPTPLEHTSL